jgi:hypothetical protein
MLFPPVTGREGCPSELLPSCHSEPFSSCHSERSEESARRSG